MAPVSALWPPPSVPPPHAALASGPPLSWPPLGVPGALTSAATYARGAIPADSLSPSASQLAGGGGSSPGMGTVAIVAIVAVAGSLLIICLTAVFCKGGPAARAADAAEARRQDAAATAAARRQSRISEKPKALGLSDSIRESFPTFVYSKSAPVHPLTASPPPNSNSKPLAAAAASAAAATPASSVDGAPASEESLNTGAAPGAEIEGNAAAHDRVSFASGADEEDPEPVDLPESFPAGGRQGARGSEARASCQEGAVSQVPEVASGTAPQEEESMPQEEGEVSASSPHEGALEVAVSAQDCCTVCLAEFEEGDVLLQLPCQHAFHAGCVESWLTSHVTCPICRRLLQPPREASQHGPRGGSQQYTSQGQGHLPHLAGTPGVEASGPSELAVEGTPGQGEQQGELHTSVDIEGPNAEATDTQAQAAPKNPLATAWHRVVGRKRWGVRAHQPEQNCPAPEQGDLNMSPLPSPRQSA